MRWRTIRTISPTLAEACPPEPSQRQIQDKERCGEGDRMSARVGGHGYHRGGRRLSDAHGADLVEEGSATGRGFTEHVIGGTMPRIESTALNIPPFDL